MRRRNTICAPLPLTALALLLPPLITNSADAAGQGALRAGMRIHSGFRARSGEWRLADPGDGALRVTGHDYTLDLESVRLVGPGSNRGIGLHIADARNVTIKGLSCAGYLWGICIERSSNIRLVGCVASHNADLPPGTVIDESGTAPEDDHGGGIVLRDCRNCTVLGCAAEHEWDGIDIVRSEGCSVTYGNYSYNGNWGVHLWSSSRNVFAHNRAVWCTTGAGNLYQSIRGWQTYDAQAVGIDHNSNENRIENNDLRFGGDGIFIRANEGGVAPGTQTPPRDSSDRNILRFNDCSFSPNNAIEVDFVEGTVIEANNCSCSNYGMWLGYARNCVVRRNICIDDSTRAVEIENGQRDLFQRNVFGFETPRADASLIVLRQNGRDKTPSGPYRFDGNLYYGAGIGIRLTATSLSDAGDIFEGAAAGARLILGDAASHAVEAGSRLNGGGDAPVITSAGPLEVNGANKVEGDHLVDGDLPTIAEIDGIPLQCVTANGRVLFHLVRDFWNRPAPQSAEVRVRTANGLSPGASASVLWQPGALRITTVAPEGASGVRVSVMGLAGRPLRLLLNGCQVMFDAPRAAADEVTVTVPLQGPSPPDGGYNLVAIAGTGAESIQSAPVSLVRSPKP